MKKEEAILFSGAAQGAETYFGVCAEKYGIDEVNFSYEGRQVERTRGIRILTHEELKNGDTSLNYVSKLLNRVYSNTDSIRKVLQTIWYQINNSQQIFVIGEILEDKTIKGGTGWGAEFAKICNKSLFVFDQKLNKWFVWETAEWKQIEKPIINEKHFCGTGTRFLEENGKKAIDDLFAASF